MFTSIKNTFISLFNSNNINNSNINNSNQNELNPKNIYNEYQVLLLNLSKISNKLHTIEIELEKDIEFNYKKYLQNKYNILIQEYIDTEQNIIFLRTTYPKLF